MEKRHDQKERAENAKNSDLKQQLDSDVNTTGFTKPYGESQTIQEDPSIDPNETDKPGFERNKDA